MRSTTSAVTGTLTAAAVLLGLWTCIDPTEPRGRTPGQMRPSLSAAMSSTVMLLAGDIADCTRTGDEKTATLVQGILAQDATASVQTLGDNAYEHATAEEYANCYAPTWGQFKARTRPQIGNHEYAVSVTATFDYFGDSVFNNNRPGGYYSYDVGDWHVIVLNDNNTNVNIQTGSAQEVWLRNDLASNTKNCTMAVWHGPRFYSTNATAPAVRTTVRTAWVDLYEAHADLIVNGHEHYYERHAPQDPDGNATPDGIRQIIIGTGGAATQPTPTVGISPNSEVRHGGVDQYGVMKLTLTSGGYSWQFLPIPGVNFTDSGSGTCHGQAANAAPTAAPGGPYTGAEGVPTAFNGSGSSDPDNQPITYAWDFGDGTSGTGVKPSHLYADNGSYTVTLVVTDSKGLPSTPQTTTVSIAETPTAVSAGPGAALSAGGEFTLAASFGDGTADGPWRYTVDWGDQTSFSDTASAPGNITGTHTYSTTQLYVARVTVTAAQGNPITDSAFVTVGGATLVGAGTIARCEQKYDEATGSVVNGIPGTVFTLGDNVLTGADSDFVNCYNPSWGQLLARTRPVAGDKEYLVSGAGPYFTYFGAAAGDRAKGYYSYDLGGWHVIVLNTSLSTSATSPQVLWLKSDLQAHPQACTMALFHYPLFSSGASAPRTAVKPLWDALYQYGADLVLNGHYAIYERFAPQTPAGAADPTRGITEFTVGTGGQNSNSIVTVADNSQIRANGTYGVLKLTLPPNGFTWAYVNAAGKSVTDAGSTVCH